MYLCDLTPACSVWSILPPCWLQAGLFRPCSTRQGCTVLALSAGAIWPLCTARWDTAASPESRAAKPDACSAGLGPWHSNRTTAMYLFIKSGPWACRMWTWLSVFNQNKIDFWLDAHLQTLSSLLSHFTLLWKHCNRSTKHLHNLPVFRGEIWIIGHPLQSPHCTHVIADALNILVFILWVTTPAWRASR